MFRYLWQKNFVAIERSFSPDQIYGMQHLIDNAMSQSNTIATSALNSYHSAPSGHGQSDASQSFFAAYKLKDQGNEANPTPIRIKIADYSTPVPSAPNQLPSSNYPTYPATNFFQPSADSSNYYTPNAPTQQTYPNPTTNGDAQIYQGPSFFSQSSPQDFVGALPSATAPAPAPAQTYTGASFFPQSSPQNFFNALPSSTGSNTYGKASYFQNATWGSK